MLHASECGAQELRRGAEAACIYSLAFSRAASPEWLAVSSDKGTVHVFSLATSSVERPGTAKQQQPLARNGTGSSGTANPVSALSFVSVSTDGLSALQCLSKRIELK